MISGFTSSHSCRMQVEITKYFGQREEFQDYATSLPGSLHLGNNFRLLKVFNTVPRTCYPVKVA